MNPMVPGLSGGKMSSSDPKSKIDFLDSPADVKSKIKAAVCTPGQVEDNGVLAFIKAVLIPVQNLREEQAKLRGEEHAPRGEKSGSFVKPDAPLGTVFSVPRKADFGGDIHFASYQELEDAYAKEELHPGDLKNGVTEALVALLTPIKEKFEADPEWKEVERLGYPDQSVQPATKVKEKASHPLFPNLGGSVLIVSEHEKGIKDDSTNRGRTSAVEGTKGSREKGQSGGGGSSSGRTGRCQWFSSNISIGPQKQSSGRRGCHPSIHLHFRFQLQSCELKIIYLDL